MDEQIKIELTADQAIVLVDWLARTSDSKGPVPFVDQAEQRVLWDLEAMLESRLPHVVSSDFADRLDAARARVRD